MSYPTRILSLFIPCWLSAFATAEEVPATWIRAPEGFKVTQFANDALATNIYSMTTDRLGRVVVAGPGYIKILIDDDGDGKAESAKLFSDRPRNGAQGLCFVGTDLYCVGDGGLLRFRDADRDDRADGPPTLMIPLQTGGEHDSHAIRRGPDGWWYLISGNYSKVGFNQITSTRSPVKKPSAGVLSRISPDFKTTEILMDGFRNSYDFDFDSAGDLYVYDSDGERDVTLPWYQPTRVFRVHPGAHAGWISRSWKRPDYFPDMPNVIARLGRGSPTGVACYRHWQFPKKYRGNLFVLDWTFGRVIALRRSGDSDPKKPATFDRELFLSGKGVTGFAPTDICVGVDGSIYVSVGGRSTQGTVYRVRFADPKIPVGPIEPPETVIDCLDLPQPLSAWSQQLTQVATQRFKKSDFEKQLFNESLSIGLRARCVEILTAYYDGISQEALERIDEIGDSTIQKKLAWSIFQKPLSSVKPSTVFHFVNHPNSGVRQAAFEKLTGHTNVPSFMAEPLRNACETSNRDLQKAAAFFIASAGFRPGDYIENNRFDQTPLFELIGMLTRKPAYQNDYFQIGLSRLANKNLTPMESLDLIRFLELSLGDVGPSNGRPQVFESVARQNQAKPKAFSAAEIDTLIQLVGHDNRDVRTESYRLISMLRLDSKPLRNAMLDRVSKDSDVVEDIQILACLANTGTSTGDARQKIANTFLTLQTKIDLQQRNQDRNWIPRIKEILTRIGSSDSELGTEIAKQGISNIGQAFLLDVIPKDRQQDVINRFANKIKQDDTEIDSSIIALLSRSSDPEHWQMIRDSFDSPANRDSIIVLLARKPYAADRKLFVQGLESAQVKTIRLSAQSLLNLGASQTAQEQVALFRAIVRTGGDKEGFATREWVVRVLQKNLGRSFGFQFGESGYQNQPQFEQKLTEFLIQKFPDQSKEFQRPGKLNLVEFRAELGLVDWQKGNLDRGIKLYQKLSCNNCHGSRNRLGPDLAGVSKRFSREDLFRAIADPDFQVPSRYQTTLFETEDGRIHSGIIIYDSEDGVLLRDSNNQTLRIEKRQIVRRQKIARSLMPQDLLKGLDSQGYADLYAYLKSL